MSRKRSLSAPLALALDGSLLLNASGLLEPALVSQVARALSVQPGDVFIGKRLPAPQRTVALNRFDDAAAEAAARIHGLAAGAGARPSPPRQRKKRRPPR